MPIVSRESYNVESDVVTSSLAEAFAKSLEKISVEPVRPQSIYEQITSIMGNKSKYPTVEAAVEDMKERSGLKAFIKQLHVQGENSDDTVKKADVEVPLFKTNPQIKQTIDNYIEDTLGNLPIPAILYKVKSIHRSDVADDALWRDDALLRYVSSKNQATKSKYPFEDTNFNDLGKLPKSNNDEIDPSNTDALHALLPTSFK